MADTRRTKPQTPDLFSAAVQRAGPAEVGRAAPPQLLLPKDLPASLQHLSDEDLLRLKAAAENELTRRKGLVPRADQDSAAERFSVPRRSKPTQKITRTTTLSPALAKVVRAALKAGVKPNAVARQFGLSLAAIQKVLSETKS